jgi:hypothetical protein
MTPLEPISDEQFRNAIDRLARSDDGRTLYLFLQRSLMAVPMALDDGALRAHHGERMFAAKLIGLMAKGISESGGRSDASGPGSGSGGGDQPIVFAVAGPRRVADAGRAGSGRRVTRDTVVPGWNDKQGG